MRVKKSTAWWVGVLDLTGLYVATMLAAPEALPSIGGAIVLALAFATVGYQGALVADNWQRSVNYRPELDKGERCGEEN